MAAPATTPQPPYFAVIFTSVRTEGENGYAEVAKQMLARIIHEPLTLARFSLAFCRVNPQIVCFTNRVKRWGVPQRWDLPRKSGSAAASTSTLMNNSGLELASKQPGVLGFETARQELGISVSYWSSLEAIKAWKEHSTHREAQSRAKDWYKSFRVHVSRVEREYGF